MRFPKSHAAQRLVAHSPEERDRRESESLKRQENLLAVEILALKASGLTQIEAVAAALGRLAQPQIRLAMPDDERARLAGSPMFEVMPNQFLPSYFVLTNQRILWVVAPAFETVYSNLTLEAIVEVSQAPYGPAGNAVRITYRPADFADTLRKYNPAGELDATFLFPGGSSAECVRLGLLARLGHAGPYDLPGLAAAAGRFREQSGKPVRGWAICPICCDELERKTEHAAQCASHLHVFSDPAVRPVVSEGRDLLGELIGETFWRPLVEYEFEMQDRTLVWLVRPPGVNGPPLQIWHGVMKQASL